MILEVNAQVDQAKQPQGNEDGNQWGQGLAEHGDIEISILEILYVGTFAFFFALAFGFFWISVSKRLVLKEKVSPPVLQYKSLSMLYRPRTFLTCFSNLLILPVAINT